MLRKERIFREMSFSLSLCYVWCSEQLRQSVFLGLTAGLKNPVWLENLCPSFVSIQGSKDTLASRLHFVPWSHWPLRDWLSLFLWLRTGTNSSVPSRDPLKGSPSSFTASGNCGWPQGWHGAFLLSLFSVRHPELSLLPYLRTSWWAAKDPHHLQQ